MENTSCSSQCQSLSTLVSQPAEQHGTDDMSLIIKNTDSDSITCSKEKIEWLREQREVHRHSTIWTKDPHGGPYKKATGGDGIDPFKENLDGSLKTVELGYEVAEVGPTSNFVGNHMTQGAIDMVQALLQVKHTRHSQETEQPRPLLLSDTSENNSNREARVQSDIMVVPRAPGKKVNRDNSHKTLRVVEWRDNTSGDEDTAVVLLERPYAENVHSCTMHLTTSFTATSVNIEYRMVGKDGKIMKKYTYSVDDCDLVPDQCCCYLGSGTLEEMKASPNLAGADIQVSHSDESTVICLVLAGGNQKQLQQLQHGAVSESDTHLSSLKSFIRRSRRS